jgi:hypothetical protein
LLQNVVDRAFASRYGDKALMALGEIAFESGEYAAARWYWEQILPTGVTAGSSPTWPSYPDTTLDVAAVRARLVLASILARQAARAQAEIAEFARLHPDAEGRVGDLQGRYVDSLQTLLKQSLAWPPKRSDANWSTLAGNFERNKVAQPLTDIGSIAWRRTLRSDKSHEAPRSIPAGELQSPAQRGQVHVFGAYRLAEGSGYQPKNGPDPDIEVLLDKAGTGLTGGFSTLSGKRTD